MANGLDQECELKPALAHFMNKATASRKEVMKALWAYIKTNNLQNEQDGRIIHPDDKLNKILGDQPLNMMKMTAMVNKLIVKA